MRLSSSGIPWGLIIWGAFILLAPQFLFIVVGLSTLVLLTPILLVAAYVAYIKFKVRNLAQQAAARQAQQRAYQQQRTTSHRQARQESKTVIECEEYHVIKDE